MPYKRPYTKKRTYARKSRPRKSNLAREVRLIKRTIKPELKVYLPSPGDSVTQSCQYDLINDVAIGTAGYQRIGNQINCRSVQIRGTLAIDTTLTDVQPVRVRLMLVWYKEPNGYVLDDNALWPAGAPTVDEFTSYVDRKTFKVLYDKTFTLCNTIKPLQAIRINKKLGSVTEFDEGGNINSGALYWVRIQDVSSATPSIVHNVTGRLYYTDC